MAPTIVADLAYLGALHGTTVPSMLQRGEFGEIPSMEIVWKIRTKIKPE